MSTEPALLDVRPDAEFVAGHAADAAHIPLEELAASSHELPSASTPLRLFDSNPQRATIAMEILQRRGHKVEIVSPQSLVHSALGRSRVRLWKPNPFLEEAFACLNLPSQARALDVACGSGRDAVWLALNGVQVDALDHLPDALERAQALARRNQVTIRTVQKDIEADPTLPVGYDLVCVFRYLHRPLWSALRESIKPGGCIIYETFHERTRETGLRPASAEHLLRTGELAAAFDGFELLLNRDAVARAGRYFSSILARRKAV